MHCCHGRSFKFGNPKGHVPERMGGGPSSSRRAAVKVSHGGPPHAADLPGGNLIHPELESLGACQVSFDFLHAHVDGQHEEMKVAPHFLLQDLMQVVLTAKAGEDVYKNQSLDVELRMNLSQSLSG